MERPATQSLKKQEIFTRVAARRNDEWHNWLPIFLMTRARKPVTGAIMCHNVPQRNAPLRKRLRRGNHGEPPIPRVFHESTHKRCKLRACLAPASCHRCNTNASRPCCKRLPIIQCPRAAAKYCRIVSGQHLQSARLLCHNARQDRP